MGEYIRSILFHEREMFLKSCFNEIITQYMFINYVKCKLIVQYKTKKSIEQTVIITFVHSVIKFVVKCYYDNTLARAKEKIAVLKEYCAKGKLRI